jgi:hypothetical protein
MRKTLRAAALAAGALLCLTASQAFAGLTLRGVQDGGSWFVGYDIDVSTFAGLTFNKIEVTIDNGNPMTFNPPAPASPTTFGTGGSAATTSVFEASDTDSVLGGTQVQRFADDSIISGAATQKGTFPDFQNSIGGHHATWSESHLGTSSSTFATATGGATNYLTFWLHLTGEPTDGTRYRLTVYSDATVIATGQAYYKAQPTAIDAFQELNVVPLPASVWAGLATLGGMGLLLVQRRRNRKVLV